MFKKLLKGIAAVYLVSLAAIVGFVILINLIFYSLR